MPATALVDRNRRDVDGADHTGQSPVSPVVSSRLRPMHGIPGQLAAVGKAFASAKRLEPIDLVSQGERTVEPLAREPGLGVSTDAATLQVLKLHNLVGPRSEGTRVHYRVVA